MDENYLDSLLNEVSLDKEIDHKIEEELDNQIQKEKRQYQEQLVVSDEDLFNLDLESDISDIQTDQDLKFSEEQMDELDHLDNLADLDIGDLDFSDIDFDALDVTKLDGVEADDLDDLLKDFEDDFDIGNLFDSNTASSQENEESKSTLDSVSNYSENDFNEEFNEKESFSKADLNEDSFDADSFLDSLLDDVDGSQTTDIPEAPQADAASEKSEQLSADKNDDSSEEELDLLQALEEFGGFEETAESKEGPVSQLTDAENDDLDDLLSLLDLDDFSSDSTANEVEESELKPAPKNNETLIDLDDIEELPSTKPSKKQKFMEVLFGEPDEDDIISEEEIAEIEAKKAAKKAKKAANKKAKEEKAKAAKEEKTVKNNQKKKADKEKKILKAQKKARLRAQELADAEPEKKLNKPMVFFIFTLFLGGTFLFFLASNNFNYSQAIERATNYFANQKYRKAYDEIVGVEVKEKDEDLKDRIYTVMYVERLYESYFNNVELGRPEKALDSLLRGVDKYYEHFEEAKELGITSDLDYSFNQIKTVLNEQYGITVEQAIEINQLPNYDYVQYIQSVVGESSIPELNDMSEDMTGEEASNTEVDSEDAILPEKEKEEVEE